MHGVIQRTAKHRISPLIFWQIYEERAIRFPDLGIPIEPLHPPFASPFV